MATEKKLKDPAEAALSAIEQALNLDALTPTGTESRAEPRLPDVGDADPLLDGTLDPAGRTMPPRLDLDAPLVSDLPPPGLERPRREGGLLPPDRSLVANDDRRNIGILQQTLRVRSSPKPYLFALAANGEAGVTNVLQILRSGIDEALLGLGKSSVHDLVPEDLIIPDGFTRTATG